MSSPWLTGHGYPANQKKAAPVLTNRKTALVYSMCCQAQLQVSVGTLCSRTCVVCVFIPFILTPVDTTVGVMWSTSTYTGRCHTEGMPHGAFGFDHDMSLSHVSSCGAYTLVFIREEGFSRRPSPTSTLTSKNMQLTKHSFPTANCGVFPTVVYSRQT